MEIKTITLACFTFNVVISVAQPGSLDNTFGNNGKTIFELGSSYGNVASSMLVQNDGKIVVGGSQAGLNFYDFTLVRFNHDGSPDLSFGNGGKASTSFGNTFQNEASSVAVQNDGKIVLAGYAGVAPGNWDIALVRYNTNGTCDSTFGMNGLVITSLGPRYDCASSLLIQNDGKLVIAAISQDSTDNFQIAVMRYNADGTLDNGFGFGGKTMAPFIVSNPPGKYSLAIQNDGKIVLGGIKSNGNPKLNDFALMRLTSDGSIDSTFGTSGIVTTDFRNTNDGISSIIIQVDGKILATGNSDSANAAMALARYNSDGTLDNTFGTFGKTILNLGSKFGTCRSAAIQSDNKILLAGWIKDPSAVVTQPNWGSNLNIGLVRYNADGILDTTFGVSGIVVTDLGYDDEYASGVALQNDGRILLAGTILRDYVHYFGNEYDMVVLRYNSSLATGIQTDYGKKIEKEIYPNPSSGIFKMNLGNNTVETTLRVYDVMGNDLWSKHYRNEISPVIDLSCLPKGMYFLETASGGKSAVQKIVLE